MPPKLGGKQLRHLYMTITSNNPLQLGFEFALWALAMIRELIRDQFGVRLSEVSDGRLRLLILRPYSPHLNLDEWVWNWLKRQKIGKARVAGPDQFRTLVEHYPRLSISQWLRRFRGKQSELPVLNP